jgi:enamine deaminase RidA (YjgF/YER057c/UK114 family)
VRKAIRPANFPFFNPDRYTFSLGIESDDSAWLSGHTASRYAPEVDQIVVEGDLEKQAAVAHEKVLSILSAAGMGPQHVASITDYVTEAALDNYGEVLKARQRVLSQPNYSCSRVVVERLLREAALLEIEVVAGKELPREVQDPQTGAVVGTRLGDLVFLSGRLSVNQDGEIVGKHDVAAQCAEILRQTTKVLESLQMSPQNLVKTLDLIVVEALTSYRETATARRNALANPFPAATGIPVSRLGSSDALIQIGAVAFSGTTEAVSPNRGRYSRLTYSPAMFAGDYLFCSGQFAVHGESFESLFPDDIVAQTRFVYESILSLLQSCGLGEEAIVKTVEYIAAEGLLRYPETAKVRQELFSKPYPAATGVVVPRLLRPEMLIEVECVAHRETRRRSSDA